MKLLGLVLGVIWSIGPLLAADVLPAPLKLLVINPIKSEIILNDIERRMINKVVLKTCAKQSGYEISMGEIGIAREAGLSIFDVTLSLTGNDTNMVITGVLLDEKNKILLKKISKQGVERLHLMRSVEDVMNGLFPPGNRRHSAK
jgi:hypothetical protein